MNTVMEPETMTRKPPAAPLHLDDRNPAHLTLLPRNQVNPWVALMYHDIVPSADRINNHWDVVAPTFAAQLDWLRDNGYRAESLENVIANPDPRSVAITFDDGYIGEYEHGFRLLAERGMRATFFATTDWVGRPGFVTWDNLREMAAAGMSIQSHTVTHPFLSTLDEAGVRRELRDSKAVLERRLQQETTSLSLPGGDFPRNQLVSLVRAAGYRFVATSEPGVNDCHDGEREPLWIDRLTVRGGQPFAHFRRQIGQDRRLLAKAWAKYSALNLARNVLGREHYHQWRKRIEVSFPAVVRMLGA